MDLADRRSKIHRQRRERLSLYFRELLHGDSVAADLLLTALVSSALPHHHICVSIAQVNCLVLLTVF